VFTLRLGHVKERPPAPLLLPPEEEASGIGFASMMETASSVKLKRTKIRTSPCTVKIAFFQSLSPWTENRIFVSFCAPHCLTVRIEIVPPTRTFGTNWLTMCSERKELLASLNWQSRPSKRCTACARQLAEMLPDPSSVTPTKIESLSLCLLSSTRMVTSLLSGTGVLTAKRTWPSFAARADRRSSLNSMSVFGWLYSHMIGGIGGGVSAIGVRSASAGMN